MNICQNCKHKFELEPNAELICPNCGEPVGSQLTLDADQDLTMNSTDDEFELEIASGDEKTFASTQDTDHADDLILPRAPITPGQSTEPIDSIAFAETERSTVEGDDEDDFELSSPEKTELATEFYNPEENQPTIEIGEQHRSTAMQDYAERMIAGLIPGDKVSPDADYIISMQDSDSELGSGASGVVYKATQKSLDRLVAIKLLKKQIMSGTQSQSRKTTPKQRDIEKFLYESQITAGLDHPNVITVHDLGVTSNDTLFYSMKLFEGGRDWSKDFDKNSLEQNLDIFNDVCDAMRRAHRDRIVHRDLKPQNVLVGDFGEVQVTDWGLAIDLNRESGKQFSGGGTPCYMAPEMAQHYLAQQSVKTLSAKLEWTLENAPDNTDEIDLIKQKIADNEFDEQKYRAHIGEVSDVYVLGAILFHIASGYPPHLFQINDLQRKRWGSQSGRNKVRKELEMAANRTIARYVVKGLANQEAREALRDIALKAMAANPEDRYADVAALQQAVRDFRDFMRCIEDTHRGNREVESSKEDPKSYVNLNNAMYAYEGALENYPEYEPANTGLAHAKFLFSERALNNQDFELGLSTMTDEAIEQQPDKELANRLRDELVAQRNRRDRRKKLLFAATMASLVSIALGVIFLIGAVLARLDAAEQTRIAELKKNEAAAAEKREYDAKIELKDGLADLITSMDKTIDLEVQAAIGQQELANILQAKDVAEFATRIAEFDTEFAQIESEKAELTARLADVNSKIAEQDLIKANISSEQIKEATQFNQYVNRLKNIESSIDEAITRKQLEDLFLSEDISLPVKNAWEMHHLYKRAHPASAPMLNPTLGRFKLFDASDDGQVIVAVSRQNLLYRCSASDTSFSLIDEVDADPASVTSIDVSSDGRWLVVARDALQNQTASGPEGLPLVYDLKRNRAMRFTASFAEQLRFQSLRLDSDGKKCKEKYFCNPQHVQILSSDDDRFQLFMVDQRSQLGLNQLRCSVSDVLLKDALLTADVQKVKVAGKLFIKNPGLLTGARCLATAMKTDDGSIYVAIVNSHPKFGLAVFSFSDTVNAQQEILRSESKRGEVNYFSAMKKGREFLDRLSTNFAPTALEFTESAAGEIKLLVGNGKGEIADLTYRASQDDSFMLTVAKRNMLDAETATKFETWSEIVSRGSTRLTVDRNRDSVFVSLGVPPEKVSQMPSGSGVPVHKTAVRAIRSFANRLYSISESEILVWEQIDDAWIARKRLFGQSGNLAGIVVTDVNQKTEVYTVSNLFDGTSEMRRWQLDTSIHDATIRISDFRNQATDSVKQIVVGAADKKTNSQAVALAFDDGSVEYFSPDTGRVAIGKLTENDLPNELDAMSRDDFRNGRFEYFDDRQQFVMYSNSIGLLTWNLDDPNQTDPLKSKQAAGLYRGATSNSSVFFSADKTGQNIVTSHPRKRDMIVLWQMRDDEEYVASEIGPFRKMGTQHSSRLNIVVQPVISPDGKVIAVVLRLRNSYQVQLLAATPTRNPQKLGVFESETRTNFRSVHFLNDQQIVVSEDRITSGVERKLGLLSLIEENGGWKDQIIAIPKTLTDEFRQISLANAAMVNGNATFVGFGVERDASEADSGQPEVKVDGIDCIRSTNNRELIAWDSSGVILRRQIPFSRRIAPRIEGGHLFYMVTGTQTNSTVLQRVNLGNPEHEAASYVLKNSGSDEPARRWQLMNNDQIAYAGDEWLHVARREEKELAPPRFEFSLANPAKRIELAGDSLLVHHRDDSVSLANLENKLKSERKKVKRLVGFHSYVSLSPDGLFVAVVKKADGQVAVFQAQELFGDDDVKPIEIQQKAFGLTWIRGAALQELGAEIQDDCLVTASNADGSIDLKFWNANGTPVQVDESVLTLPLETVRDGSPLKSFEFSPVTGLLASAVWETKEADRADIWRYTATEKPADGEDPKAIPHEWFLVNDSKVGQIESVHFGEVIDQEIPSEIVAPRIVISADDEGSKSVKLYALELDLNLRVKPLLNLFVADKLQQVDKIVGAQFTGDGKTLLTMTSENAQVRLSDGWRRDKKNVDFAQEVRLFQDQQIDKTAFGALEKQKNDLVREQQKQESNPRLVELTRKKAEQEKLKTEAEEELAKKIAKLKNDKQAIRSKLTADIRGRIADVTQQIEDIQKEISELDSRRSESSGAN